MASTAVGAVFGRLTVAARVDQNTVDCVCICGGTRRVLRCNLLAGRTRSCGCLLAEARIVNSSTHGYSKTPTYSSWVSMLTRCENASCKSFKNYGGRGINVCERWHSFEAFLADMGEKKPGESIERADVNGDYEPSNCHWATPREQARNTRRTKLTYEIVVALRSGRMTRAEAIAMTGANRSTVQAAIEGRNWKDIHGTDPQA